MSTPGSLLVSANAAHAKAPARQAHLRQQNRRISAKIPLGYDLAPDGVSLVPNACEQALIARITAWRRRGWSLGRIARKLEAEAFPTKNKARWYPITISRILARQARLTGSAT